MNVVVSHVYDSTRVTLCRGFLSCFQTSVYQTGQAHILYQTGQERRIDGETERRRERRSLFKFGELFSDTMHCFTRGPTLY